MPESLPHSVVHSVAIGNLKAIAEQPAMISNLAYGNLVANTNLSQQNAVAYQQAMNELGLALVGRVSGNVTNLSPLESRSATDVLTQNDMAQLLASLKAVLTELQALRQTLDQ